MVGRLMGQRRFRPDGQVLGFDIQAALALGRALAVPERAVAELLPPIEAAMLAAQNGVSD